MPTELPPSSSYPFVVRYFSPRRIKRLAVQAVGKKVGSLHSTDDVEYNTVAEDMEHFDRRTFEIRQLHRINLVVQKGRVIDAFIG